VRRKSGTTRNKPYNAKQEKVVRLSEGEGSKTSGEEESDSVKEKKA